jgi:hypothetical protein
VGRGRDRRRQRDARRRAHRIGHERFGEAEVEHLDRAVGPHLHVGRLQIAVDDALFVRGFECLGHLLRDRQRVIDPDGARGDAVSERRPFDQLHDERRGSGRPFEAVDGGDVRMVEGGERLRFAIEARQALCVRGHGVGEDLDGHLPREVRVGRAIDLTHPALADLNGHFVWTEAGAGRKRHGRDSTVSVAGRGGASGSQLFRTDEAYEADLRPA